MGVIKAVPITLDKERMLRCTNAAAEYIHERTGLNLYAGENILGDPVTPRNLNIVLFALLRHEDKDLTPEQCGELWDTPAMDQIIAPVLRAVSGKSEAEILAAIEEERGKLARPTLPDDSPAGSSSGDSPAQVSG